MDNSNFPNFNFSTSPQGFNPYGYFPQHLNPNFYSYYHSQHGNIMPRPYYSPFQTLTHEQRGPSVIKIEQDSYQNQELHRENKHFKQKTAKKNKNLPKISQSNKNIYLHPPKQAKHKVKYFDPNAAPVVTSSDYNLVQSTQKENARQELIYSQNTDNVNEILYPEEDENIFIVYRYRRIKKKFKKYIRPKNQNFFNNCQRDDSDHNSDNSSDSSSSSSNNQEEPKISPQCKVPDLNQSIKNIKEQKTIKVAKKKA